MTEDDKDIRVMNLIGWGFLATLVGLGVWVGYR